MRKRRGFSHPTVKRVKKGRVLCASLLPVSPKEQGERGTSLRLILFSERENGTPLCASFPTLNRENGTPLCASFSPNLRENGHLSAQHASHTSGCSTGTMVGIVQGVVRHHGGYTPGCIAWYASLPPYITWYASLPPYTTLVYTTLYHPGVYHPIPPWCIPLRTTLGTPATVLPDPS